MPVDSEIAGRIRKGDKAEFESLFRSSYVSLVKYARPLIKDQDTAEEIVQDLFVRLWQEKEKIKIESSLSGYLFRSVHNRCLLLNTVKLWNVMPERFQQERRTLQKILQKSCITRISRPE